MTGVIGYGNLIDTATLGGTVTSSANIQNRYLAQKASGGTPPSAFLPLSQTSRAWRGMTALGSDVYACVHGGDIYKQTGGTGNFVALSQTSRAWHGITTLGSDVYACVDNGDIYKQTGGTGVYLDIDLGSEKHIGVVAVVSHTQAGGTIRIQGGISAGSGSAYDSTALAIYSGSDYAITFEPASARYWRITWSEQMSCGRVFIGPRFKPANNFDWGPSFARESDSVVGKALSGMEFGDKRPSRRVWRGAFSWLTPAEADAFDTLMASADITDEVYWIEEETDTTYRGKRWFLGRFRTLSPIEYPYLNVHKVGVEIGELL